MALKILDIKDKCTACGACVSICPKEALILQPEEKTGFYYPVLNENKCVECHLCEKTCHVLNPQKKYEEARKPFTVKVHDRSVLKRSSSGGAFSLLAEDVLSMNGVVFGAAYNFDEEKLEEKSTEEVCLDELRKSKYIESYCGSIFSDVERKLRTDKDVLFCGTPCQIKGLSHYLSQKRCPREKLVLVQFLCHGVPANMFFTEQKHVIENKYNAKITAIDFRSKKYGWRTAFFEYKTNKNHHRVVRGDSTYFMSAFFKYYMLRDSCYGCTIFDQGYADITIADFWGLFKYDPANKENEGLSLVIAHNDKALLMVEKMKDRAIVEELPLSAIDYIRRPQSHVDEMLETKRRMEKQIALEGYMPYMNRVLEKSVRKGKIKDMIGKILFKLGIWKINK